MSTTAPVSTFTWWAQPSRKDLSASLGRKNTTQDKQFAQLDAVARIDVEDVDGGTSARGQTDKLWTLPGKVTAPALPARIEQYDDATRDEVAAAQITRFRRVAFEACPGEVCGIVGAVVFLGNDVFKVKAEERLIRFMQAAILAALVGPQADEPPDRPFQAGCLLRARRMRALALRMAMK